MPSNLISGSSSWLGFDWQAMSTASKVLIAYGGVMWLSCAVTYFMSANDARVIREVGVWVKPMKFMAATALFAWTTVGLSYLGSASVTHSPAYNWISVLIISTSFFEVAYITYQAAQGEASHYNTIDIVHALLFGLMALAAVGLTASQAWLAWEIWKETQFSEMSAIRLSVVIGLAMTFLLSTISGFLLGGHQPPAGQGLPVVGWHLYKDIRPSHFLGVHAQQFIPLFGLFADRFLGIFSIQGLCIGSVFYLIVWTFLTWTSFRA